MATFQAMLMTAGSVATAGQAMPLPIGNSRGGPGGVVTPSTTSQIVQNGGVDLVAPQSPGLIWHLHADAGPVWVTFGAAPVAAPGVSWLMSAGDTLDLVAFAGDKCAVITAP